MRATVLRGLILRGRLLEPRTALPRVIGDVEGVEIGPVELGLEEPFRLLGPPGEALRAELLELPRIGIHVVDQHAEMMEAAEVEPEPLVPGEMQDRDAHGAVAQ